MKSGPMAKTAGVGIDAVRFDGREGSLPGSTGQSSGSRDPASEAVPDLQSVKRAEASACSLNAISERLPINREPDAKAGDVEKPAEEEPADLEDPLHSLQEMKETFRKITERGPGRDPTSDCSILQSKGREE